MHTAKFLLQRKSKQVKNYYFSAFYVKQYHPLMASIYNFSTGVSLYFINSTCTIFLSVVYK